MTIRVSDLRLYLSCPRQVYFTSRGHERNEVITPEHIERLLLKELAFQFPSLFQTEGLPKEVFLKKESELVGVPYSGVLAIQLDEVANRIQTIYRNELKDISEVQLEEYKSKIDVEIIATGLEKGIDNSWEMLIQQITPWKVQHQLYSKRFDMTGCPDKIIQIDGELFPSIIKTGNKPEYGIWKNDKLQLTAYAILIEEEFDTIVRRALVEYCRYGEFREANIRHADRRKVLQILDKVKKIKDGALPERSEKAQCSSCGFMELCRTESSLLSKFF